MYVMYIYKITLHYITCVVLHLCYVLYMHTGSYIYSVLHTHTSTYMLCLPHAYQYIYVMSSTCRYFDKFVMYQARSSAICTTCAVSLNHEIQIVSHITFLFSYFSCALFFFISLHPWLWVLAIFFVQVNIVYEQNIILPRVVPFHQHYPDDYDELTLNLNQCIYFMFQKKANGNDLYEKVLYYQDLIETDYFGLQYTDHANVAVSSLLF